MAALPPLYIAALAVMAASTAVSVYGTYQAGQAQKKASEYNVKLYEQQAAQAREAAAIKAENYRKQAARQMATMNASFAASGVTMEGTPLLVLMESSKEAKLDELRIKHGGDVEAAGLLGSANLESMKGSQAETASYINMGSSLLRGAGSMMGTYGEGMTAGAKK